MADLPQIHDWMFNLLTMGQWTFIYIASVIVIFVSLLTLFAKVYVDETGVGGVAFGVAIIAFPLFAVAMLAIGNFISFMIYLWFGVV